MEDRNYETFPMRYELNKSKIVSPKYLNHRQDEQIDELSISWNQLSVWRSRKVNHQFWRTKKERVQILDEVSGTALGGQFTAILGPSGSGKTTLLASISGRECGDARGELRLGGRPAGPRALALASAFVPQRDVAFDVLTVSEHMAFMARMSMARSTPGSQRQRRVAELLRQLGVARCEHTLLLALSGGERKRVSLAAQLLNDPPILFCDEPTTGLDSCAAGAVAGQLRALALAGKVVVCSIHQPASHVYQMFHRVILLAAGHTAFQGTIEEAQDFFTNLNYKCPEGFNEAEYLVGIVSVKPGFTKESNSRIGRICDAYDNSECKKKLREQLSKAETSFDELISELPEKQFQRYLPLEHVGFWTGFYWLIWRFWITVKRDATLRKVEISTYLFVGFFIGVCYMGNGSVKTQNDIQNVTGLMFTSVLETYMRFMYTTLVLFPSETPVLLRDVANGLYTPGPYYLSKMIATIPRAFLGPLVYATVIYFLSGLTCNYFIFIGIIILVALVANAHGTMMSVTFDDVTVMVLSTTPFNQLNTMFSGVFIHITSIAPIFRWMRFIFVLFYSNNLVMILEFKDIDYIECPADSQSSCMRNGAEVLTQKGIHAEYFGYYILGLLVLYCFYHSVAFLILKSRSKRVPVY